MKGGYRKWKCPARSRKTEGQMDTIHKNAFAQLEQQSGKLWKMQKIFFGAVYENNFHHITLTFLCNLAKMKLTNAD
jgi:hypothetical protein